MFRFSRKNKSEPEETLIAPVFQEEEDTELVAVIAAAVASMLGKPLSGFRIRSIRRASNWKRV